MSGPERPSGSRTVARLVGGPLDGQERRLEGAPLLYAAPVFAPVPRSSSGFRDWRAAQPIGRVTYRRVRRLGDDHDGRPQFLYEAVRSQASA